MDGQSRSRRGIDAVIAALAAIQHGIVARWQLAARGIGRGAIAHRLRIGRLHPIYRGVYAVGHPTLTQEGRWMAAILAAGEGAVLSHRSAAALWEFLGPGSGQVEVSLAREIAPGAGIVAYRTQLQSSEITERNRIPVTTPVRTLLDFAAVARGTELAKAFREAQAKRRVTVEMLTRAVERRPGRRGNARLRSVLADAGYAPGVARSVLETRFLRFLRRHRLPAPDRTCGCEPDRCGSKLTASGRTTR